MIVYGAIALSFLITLGFYLQDKSQYRWWEFFIPPAATTILVIVMKLTIGAANVNFPEYWGSMVTAVYEEEPWNEWHVQICSYTTSNGKTTTTHYYDCSHQDDYGPDWWCTTNLGETFNITEKQYDELVKQFGTAKQTVKEHNNHSARSRAIRSDGTKFQGKSVGETSYVYGVAWNGTIETAKAAASQHRYRNKIKASDLSIFNISVVTEEEADSLKLFKIPELNNHLDYPTILGGNVSKNVQERFKRLNGKFGPSNQLRLWILVFEDRPSMIAKQQANYWVNGNMNELVVCIGKKDTTIQWVDAFSWTTNGTLPIQIRDYINNQGSVTERHWNELYDYLDANLGTYVRRDFEEFNYLSIKLKTWQIILIYVFGVACAIGCNIWTSNNEFEDDGSDDRSFFKKRKKNKRYR